MNLLRGSTVYLCGSIEHAQSPTSWREQIKRELLLPLGIKPYDPLAKPTFLSELAKGNPAEYRQMLIKPDQQERVFSALAEIRNLDRQFAYACDFMICNMPKVFTVGTFEELSIAAACNKPVLVYSPDGLISTWLPPMLAPNAEDYWSRVHFNEWDALYAHLRGIDDGSSGVDNLKWIFITYFNDPDIRKRMEPVDAPNNA
jgi:hypothetical protein